MQAIGLMIGFYILTRMLDLLSTDANVAVKASAVLTMVVTSACIFMLMIAESLPNGPLP